MKIGKAKMARCRPAEKKSRHPAVMRCREDKKMETKLKITERRKSRRLKGSKRQRRRKKRNEK